LFSRVLIANRGEIACRIVRTLHVMGIEAVVVYSDADASTLPVRQADVAVPLGAAPMSYLDGAAIVAAARRSGAEAIHPGYGFLAERADFAEEVEAAGLAFVGPTPEQLRSFGAKHTARSLAQAAGVPVLPASPLLTGLHDALAAGDQIGYPLVLKATAGGGGIGLRVCRDEEQLRADFEGAHRQAGAAFGDDRLYMERYLGSARHVEVQVIGDGTGRVLTLGDRDCSAQRRNQKILEEAPAPGLAPGVREELTQAAERLASSVSYRSAGTVEFLVEGSTLAFLEVNARLQVEHPVTELRYGIDLVEWMIRIAAGEPSVLDHTPAAQGHAVEARLCAENPWRGFQPSAGLLTTVEFPTDVRVDTWIDAGTEVRAHYDSLLAKIVSHAPTRHEALERMARALERTRVEAITTNVDLLRALVADPSFRAGWISTEILSDLRPAGRAVEVLSGGTQTTVQDHPGRIGLWSVGVPPSGPMDERSFRLGNRAVGNPEGMTGLELTSQGPSLVFHGAARICLTGAPSDVAVDGERLPMWEEVEVADGATLTIGAIGPPGVRAYLLFAGGIDVATALGSRATFTLGRFGGYGGRALRPGDVLRLGGMREAPAGRTIPDDERTPIGHEWEIVVLEGPHGGAEWLTADDLDVFYRSEWRVHHNSARTGVRLVGPAPAWARPDGGDAGLHPSNIHDTPYAVGAVDFTGDMPILLGPDGPSLGGFVCPAVVRTDQRWKLGQLRPDDVVRFALPRGRHAGRDGGLLDRWEPDGDRPAVEWRRSGDDYLLVEYGPMVLDLSLRFRVHALQEWLAAQALVGIFDVTPGVRSLQVHFDPARLPSGALLAALQAAEAELPDVANAVVDSRTVNLPLSWDDPATREAIERYTSTVRADAPWCPWNIEFIRRINGLGSVADVHRTVFDASYLVLGLGDVYLGAPVATPLDPRHRLVTTKYNPARTWTPENAVGIGGAYLCIYGMEGPGGYQFVGRTVPVWNRFRRTAAFTEPWLLRFFDQLRFFEVTASDLLDWRREVLTGAAELAIEPATLRLADYLQFCDEHAAEIAVFRQQQQTAFNEERARWSQAEALPVIAELSPVTPLPAGALVVEAALMASVWKVMVEVGQSVGEGDPIVVLESMKMETAVHAPRSGRVVAIMVKSGQDVLPGQPLIAMVP
jgi:urea carboxylase